MISFETIERIKSKVNIVDVISHYIDVQKKGANYVALCPFHNDSNPSMMISTSKQIFKCFVCGTAGDCFGFVRQYEKISFSAAVKKVCEICHIDEPEVQQYHEVTRIRENEEELKALEKLSNFYEYMLVTPGGKEAMQYLKSRGLNEDIIKRFGIGYAPEDSTKSIDYLRKKENFSVETLEKAGIISSSSSSFSDKYRDRIMFPLSNISGDIVGFSGRRYRKGDTQAKYMNSSESVVFKKSELLYNFNNAKDAIRKSNFVYVVEGFMDAIALYRAGISAVVGLMGTAFTKKHVELFAKMKVEVRLCLDSDEPGQMATEKCLSALSGRDIDVKVVKPLAEGKDPDEYLKDKGPEALRVALNQLESPLMHSANYGLNHQMLVTYKDKEAFLRQNRFYFFQLGKLGRDDIVTKLGKILDLTPESIKEAFESYSQKRYIQTVSNESVSSMTPAELNKREINNELFLFIRKYIDKTFLKKEFESIIRNEGQMLARIILSRNSVKIIQSLHDSFVVDSYGQMLDLLTEVYHDLRNSVEYIREEDFPKLENLAEIYYSQEFEAIRDFDASNKKALLDIENKKKITDGIIMRLQHCRYPSREFNEDDFKLLIQRHLRYKKKYVMRNPSNSPEQNSRILAQLNTIKNQH